MSLEFDITNIKSLLEAYLDEGWNSAKRMFVDSGKMTEREFTELGSLDPTRQKKYLEWMGKAYLDDKNMSKFVVMSKFDDLANRGIIQNKDIYSYGSIDDVNSIVSEKEGVLTTSQQKRGIRDQDQIDPKDIIFQNENATVVEPKTEEKSILYGRGTHWCTAAMGEGNMFDDYINEDNMVIYYILVTKENARGIRDNLQKMAIVVGVDGKWSECRDTSNNLIDNTRMKTILENLGIDKKIFKPVERQLLMKKKKSIVSEAPPQEDVYDNNSVKVVELLSKDRAIYWGQGTHWGIARPGNDNQFNNLYNNLGMRLYVIIDKITNRKVAVRVGLDGVKDFRDENNNSVPYRAASAWLRDLGLLI